MACFCCASLHGFFVEKTGHHHVRSLIANKYSWLKWSDTICLVFGYCYYRILAIPSKGREQEVNDDNMNAAGLHFRISIKMTCKIQKSLN